MDCVPWFEYCEDVVYNSDMFLTWTFYSQRVPLNCEFLKSQKLSSSVQQRVLSAHPFSGYPNWCALIGLDNYPTVHAQNGVAHQCTYFSANNRSPSRLHLCRETPLESHATTTPPAMQLTRPYIRPPSQRAPQLAVFCCSTKLTHHWCILHHCILQTPHQIPSGRPIPAFLYLEGSVGYAWPLSNWLHQDLCRSCWQR